VATYLFYSAVTEKLAHPVREFQYLENQKSIKLSQAVFASRRNFYSLTLMVCFTQKFIFADAHILFHTEITEITEKAAFGLALLRSWYLSQKSRRAQKGFRLTAKMRSHRNHGKHRNFYSLTLINYFTQKSQKTQKLAFGKGLTHAIIIRDARSCLKKEL